MNKMQAAIVLAVFALGVIGMVVALAGMDANVGSFDELAIYANTPAQ